MRASSPLTLYKISLILLICSFCLSYLFTPLVKRFAIKFGILDEPSSERKIHKTPMPLLGGIAIFFSFLISLCFLYVIISYYFSIGGAHYFIFKEKNIFWIKVGLYLICGTLILLIGILDDLKSIDFKPKLLIQSITALIMIFGGTRLNFLPWPWLNIVISFFWIVCLTNSFNLLDNMNGLSAGLSIIQIAFHIILSYVTGYYLLTVFLIIPLGCLLGFLPYNFPKSKIFLGDSGSLFIGFSLSTYSLWLFEHLIKQSSEQTNALLILLSLMCIPLCDTLTVIAIRLKNRKPFYIGDTNHLSHQLVKAGFSTTTAVIILYLSSIFISTVGLVFLSL